MTYNVFCGALNLTQYNPPSFRNGPKNLKSKIKLGVPMADLRNSYIQFGPCILDIHPAFGALKIRRRNLLLINNSGAYAQLWDLTCLAGVLWVLGGHEIVKIYFRSNTKCRGHLNWTYWNRNNSAGDCSILFKFGKWVRYVSAEVAQWLKSTYLEIKVGTAPKLNGYNSTANCSISLKFVRVWSYILTAGTLQMFKVKESKIRVTTYNVRYKQYNVISQERIGCNLAT